MIAEFVNLFLLISELSCLMRFKLYSAKLANTHAQINFYGLSLVVLRLNVPVNNFSVMSGRSHRFLGN